MKKIITCLLAVLGMTTACGQKNYEDVDVAKFAELIADSTVTVLDVRTADEFSDGHIEGAVNIDVKESDFLEKAKAMLPSGKTIAVYCRSGRRSKEAAQKLANMGYINIYEFGGIINWTGEIVTVEPAMTLKIGETKVPVSWENNPSVEDLRKLLPLTIEMSMYGGFEQVGPIGQEIASNDEQTKTGPGDIVLYSGDQIVIFYGSNSWAYTRLGHVDLTREEMTELLAHGDVTITISAGVEE
jgi:rhodanese-related sulfurtransferase